MGRKKKAIAHTADSITALQSPTGRKELECRVCNSEWVIVSMEVGSIVCSRCVTKMVAPPENPSTPKPSSGYPRGWHLKVVYEAEDGKYFSKGKEITKKEAVLLLGTTDSGTAPKSTRSKSK